MSRKSVEDNSYGDGAWYFCDVGDPRRSWCSASLVRLDLAQVFRFMVVDLGEEHSFPFRIRHTQYRMLLNYVAASD